METEQVFSLIRQQSETLTASLKRVLEKLEGGFKPTSKEFMDLMVQNEELNIAFHQMLIHVQKLTGNDRHIPQDLSLKDYEEMVQASMMQKKFRMFEDRRSVLKQFVEIQSLSQNYSDILMPFQNQAKVAVETTDPETWESDQRFKEQSDRALAFFRALHLKSDDHPDHEELMQELDRLFSPAVTRGLIFGKYAQGIPDSSCRNDLLETDTHAGRHGSLEDPPEEKVTSNELEIASDDHVNLNEAGEYEKNSGSGHLDQQAHGELGVELIPVVGDSSEKTEEINILLNADATEKFLTENLDAAEDHSYITWQNEVKERQPNTNAFIRDIERMPSPATMLLPALTRFGILTPSLALSLHQALKIKITNDDELVKFERTFEQLAAKHCVAGYSVGDPNDPAYCLTAYAWETLHKASVKGRGQFWTMGIDQFKWLAEPRMNVEDINKQLDINRKLVLFLENLKIALPDQYPMITKWIRWEKDHYTVTIHWGGKAKSCQLTDSNHLISSNQGQAMLISESNMPESITIPDDGSEYYLLVNGQLYHWENGWITQDQPVPPDNHQEKRIFSTDSGKEKVPAGESRNTIRQTVKTDPVETGIEASSSRFTPDTEQMTVPDQGIEKDEISVLNPECFSDRLGNQFEIPSSNQSLNEHTEQQFMEKILKQKETPSPEEMIELIQRRMEGPFDSHETRHRAVTEAVLLAKAAHLAYKDKPVGNKFLQLVYAANLEMTERQYTGEELSKIFEETDPDRSSWKLAAYINALLFPTISHDYTLKLLAEQVRDDIELEFPDFDGFKPLVHELLGLQEILPGGFTELNLQMLGEGTQTEEILNNLEAEASRLKQEPTLKVMLKGIPEMIQLLFGPSSTIYYGLEHVEKNLCQDKAELKQLLHEKLRIPEGESLLSPFRISDFIDESWKESAGSLKTTKELKHKARKKIEENLKERIDLINQWIEFDGDIETLNLPKITHQKDRILHRIAELRTKLIAENRANDWEFLIWVLDRVADKLQGKKSQPPYSDLLRSGIISLDERFVPILDANHQRVIYFEPWRRVLDHWNSSIPDLKTAARLIFDDSSELFDNLSQYRQIQAVLNDSEELPSLTEKTILDARRGADEKTNGFKGHLELDYMYGRVSENEKETILFQLESNKQNLYPLENYAVWRRFLQALVRQTEDLTWKKGLDLRHQIERQLESTRNPNARQMLKRSLKMLVEEKNFAVAEEYLNRVIAGDFSIGNDQSFLIPEEDSFANFISDEVFLPLHRLTSANSGKGLQYYAHDYLRTRFPDNWTNKYKDDSLQLISSWPTDKRSISSKQIGQFFSGLGFDVLNAQKETVNSETVFKVSFKQTAKNRADYRHPIAMFGTKMKKSFNVVVLFGPYDAKRLVDKITSMSLGQNTIVLLDAFLDRGARRSVAEILHTQKTQQNAFLIIDRILTLHLALHQSTERIPVMLKCTLPYSSYQPFVRDGGSTADEMFYGRNRELSTIIDPSGASVVYGGRQLGKTALLERAESRVHDPASNVFAVYSNIINCRDESSFVEKVVLDINRKTDLHIEVTSSINAFCDSIRQKLENGKIQTMLLLLDEADNFLEAISQEQYSALQPLIDLKRETKNDFKMVLAGLHNVSRAKNATTNNGLFGQLGTPLCIKPLSPLDALQLIKTPLLYLGYEHGKSSQIEMILTNTNYYPGILQFFGYTLVQNKPQQYREHYHAASGHPPYPLQDDQLGSIMNSEDLNQSIKDKFKLSLNLDPRYFMLARCITFKVYEDEGRSHSQSGGYSVEELKALADDLQVEVLSRHTDHEIRNLLDEMVDMGILSTQSGLYRLRRQAFAGIIAVDIDQALEGLMEEVG